MAWFWGRNKDDDDDDDDDDEYSYYTGSSEEEEEEANSSEEGSTGSEGGGDGEGEGETASRSLLVEQDGDGEGEEDEPEEEDDDDDEHQPPPPPTAPPTPEADDDDDDDDDPLLIRPLQVDDSTISNNSNNNSGASSTATASSSSSAVGDDDEGGLLRSDELAQLWGASPDRIKNHHSTPPPRARKENGRGAPPSPTGAVCRNSGRVLVDSEDDDEDDDDEDELLQSGEIPSVVVGAGRERLPSAVSEMEVDDPDGDGDDDEDNINNSNNKTPDEKHFNQQQQQQQPSRGERQETPATKTFAVTESDGEPEPEDEEVTSIAEKQSLLLLAAENDRVDILQAILSDTAATTAATSGSGNGTNSVGDDSATAERRFLLHPVNRDGAVTTVPPLHIAVSYGSVNTINCLLRMGADPSLRPRVAAIRRLQEEGSAEQQQRHPVEIPHLQRFDGRSAWELAFGTATGTSDDDDDNDDNENNNNRSPSSWLGFGRSSSALTSDSARSFGQEMPPSKREGIRHAFTAEALRCIGSDEVERLRQLLHAGMPAGTEIGGKTLADWSVDMGAPLCQSELQKQQQQQQQKQPSPEVNGTNNDTNTERAKSTATPDHDTATESRPATTASRKSAVLDRGCTQDHTSIPALTNRLDELESLAKALSSCCDNLAEEVSVSSGLLLVGSGAAALASHVRSLRARRERKFEQLELAAEAWDQAEDELAYWARECAPWGAERVLAEAQIASKRQQQPQRDSSSNGGGGGQTTPTTQSNGNNSSTPSSQQPSGTTTQECAADHDNDNDNEVFVQQQQQQRQHLTVQIGAMEHKIRMLRASIADLSEENARNLAEVERRGLSGGIQLVRGLRDEIREIEYELSECKSGEAACRAKISLLQSRIKQRKKNNNNAPENDEGEEGGIINSNGNSNSAQATQEDARRNGHVPNGMDTVLSNDEDEDEECKYIPESERIATGQSTALIVRPSDADRRGFLPFNIWRMILRIIGLTEDRPHSNSDAASVMIL